MTTTAIPVIACVGVDQSANAPTGEFSYSMTFEHRKRIDPVPDRNNKAFINSIKVNLAKNCATMWRIDTWSNGNIWIWWNGAENACEPPRPKKYKFGFVFKHNPGR